MIVAQDPVRGGGMDLDVRLTTKARIDMVGREVGHGHEVYRVASARDAVEVQVGGGVIRDEVEVDGVLSRVVEARLLWIDMILDVM